MQKPTKLRIPLELKQREKTRLLNQIARYKDAEPAKKEEAYAIVDQLIAKEEFVLASSLLHKMGEFEGRGHYFLDRPLAVMLGFIQPRRK